jgi:DNA (cytosine-5)-methyltransferase 1
MKNEVQSLSKFRNYDFYKYKGKQRRDKIARNLVDYEVGKTIFKTFLGVVKKENINQTELF